MVSEKYRKLLGAVQDTLSNEHNSAAYRKVIADVSPPCIPFLGLYLTDLTFIEDGNQDYLDEAKTVINFEKHHMTTTIIQKIIYFQGKPFPYRDVPLIQQYLEMKWKEMPASDQYELSVKMEPRERETDTVTRWLAEDGFL